MTFFHVLPLGRLSDLLDLKGEKVQAALRVFAPPRPAGWNNGFNADGFATTWGPNDEVRSYAQWFRFGGVEGFTSTLVARPPSHTGNQTLYLYARQFAEECNAWIPKALVVMREVFRQDPPGYFSWTAVWLG